MNRMLTMHPGLYNETNLITNPATEEYIRDLPQTQVTTKYLNGK